MIAVEEGPKIFSLAGSRWPDERLLGKKLKARTETRNIRLRVQFTKILETVKVDLPDIVGC